MKKTIKRHIEKVVVKKRLNDGDNDVYLTSPLERLKALTFIVFGGREIAPMDKTIVIKRSLK